MRPSIVLITALVSLFLAHAERADASPRARVAPAPVVRADGSIVPASPPSSEHPWGTAFVFASEWLGADSAILAVEWDVFASRELRRAELARYRSSVARIEAVRAGDDIVVLVVGGDEALVVTAASDLSQVRRDVLLHGDDGSVAVDDRWIAIGTYEYRRSLTPPTNVDGFAPQSIFHVRIFERTSHRIVAAHVFEGDELLAPHASLWRHALAFAAGRLYVSLPLVAAARIVALRMPSFAVVTRRDIAIPGEPWGSMPIFAFGAGIAALRDDFTELSPELALVSSRRMDVGGCLVAVDGGRALLPAPAPAGLAAVAIGANDVDVDAVAWTWGHAVALGHDTNDRPRILVLP